MNKFKDKRNFFKFIKDKSTSLFLLMLASCTGSITPSNRNNESNSISDSESYIRPYHHLPDGTFRNPEGSVERPDYEFPWFKFARERMAIKVNIPQDHIIKSDDVLAKLKSLEDKDTITWIGHSTFLIRLGGKTIITDPFFSPNAGPLALGPRRYIDPAISLEQLPNIDLLLVTHNHYDHLDYDATKNFPFKKAKVLCPLKLSQFYKDLNFRNIQELDWHDQTRFDNLKITLLPAIHWSKRTLTDRNHSLWGSFLIEYRGNKILFCCDTADGPVYERLGGQYGPMDLTFVNIGAYEPRELMKYSHATPEEGLDIAKQLRSNKVAGMHWGTILMSLEDPFEPPVRFKQNAKNYGYKEEDLLLFKIGETKALKEII